MISHIALSAFLKMSKSHNFLSSFYVARASLNATSGTSQYSTYCFHVIRKLTNLGAICNKNVVAYIFRNINSQGDVFILDFRVC